MERPEPEERAGSNVNTQYAPEQKEDSEEDVRVPRLVRHLRVHRVLADRTDGHERARRTVLGGCRTIGDEACSVTRRLRGLPPERGGLPHGFCRYEVAAREEPPVRERGVLLALCDEKEARGEADARHA